VSEYYLLKNEIFLLYNKREKLVNELEKLKNIILAHFADFPVKRFDDVCQQSEEQRDMFERFLQFEKKYV